MSRPTIEPCPSPTGRNAERLFLVKVPRGTSPELALDQALNRDKRMARDADVDLGQLKAKLIHFIDQCSLADEEKHMAHDIIDEHLPSGEEEEKESSFGRTYGDVIDDEEEHAEELAEKPIESSGIAGRDRRRAHDRKLAADRAGDDWLAVLVSRIGIA